MTDEPKKTDSIKPPPHNDGPTGRPERKTGMGREATVDTTAKERDAEHRSGYGGKDGVPDTSADEREKLNP
jgi:hypothetical protein